MEGPNSIENQPIPAVKSLRSKFEQLAIDISHGRPSDSRYLSPSSSRPRAASGTFNEQESSVQQLRSSSSSSDLQAKLKRPPPPIPARPSRATSPSPLLRPVPTPSTQLIDLDDSPTVSPSVAALRNQFSDQSRLGAQQPAFVSEPLLGEKSHLSSPHSRSSSTLSVSGSSLFSATEHATDSDSDSSPGNSSTFTPMLSPRKLAEPTHLPRTPPRPPPRHRVTIPILDNNTTNNNNPPPPPLPTRKPPVSPKRDPIISAPPLPCRPAVPPLPPPAEEVELPPKPNRLPPPPKRVIGLNDKLPEMRRPLTPDESSSDEEDEVERVDHMPDRTQTSRRPPLCRFLRDPKISIPATERHAAISGSTVVVASSHHLRIYDIQSQLPATPVLAADIKDLGLPKDTKLCCVAMRSSQSVWVGCTTGHLCEVDIHTGSLSGLKLSAHAGAVTHMFRTGSLMVTMDECGKTLIFPDARLTQSVQPRVVRVTEKFDFAQIIRGKLWVASRTDFNVSTSGGRVPIIRIYDANQLGAVPKTVLPTEHVGAVTGLTVVRSMPGLAYMSHEEGYISVWSLDSETCVYVMRVQISDVTSVAGVCDRLWVGTRSGSIGVFDVRQKPWVVTNQWDSPKTLPILQLLVDWESIGTAGHKLTVASIGRNGEMRFWDGLLGDDWIDRKLLKREAEFTTYRNIKILVVSWNVDSAKPQDLNINPANLSFLSDVLSSEDSPDIISFGFQEVIDLESRKMAAKSVLLQGKRKSEEGALSDHVTGAYKRWYEKLIPAVRLAMPPDTPYNVIHTESMVGLFTCIFVKSKERVLLKDIATKTVKRGMGGRYGNKGGILARFVIEDSSICLINCHLAAGQTAIRQRNADIASFLEAKDLFPESEEGNAYVDGGNGEMVLDHDIVIINGDMNYRIDQRRETAISTIHSGEFESLLSHDQLLKEMKFNKGFRLRGFCEGPLRFPPTYKYDRRSSTYDTSDKARTPAWCDRILWHTRVKDRVHQTHYQRYEADVSDHRPISAGFNVQVRNIRHELREGVKKEIELGWGEEQKRLLEEASTFYVSELLL